MANIVITSDANCVEIDMNDLAPLPNIATDKVTYRKSAIVEIQKPNGLTYLNIILSIGIVKREWPVSLDGNNDSLPIDTVDGVTPTDLDDLYTKLTALMIA